MILLQDEDGLVEVELELQEDGLEVEEDQEKVEQVLQQDVDVDVFLK